MVEMGLDLDLQPSGTAKLEAEGTIRTVATGTPRAVNVPPEAIPLLIDELPALSVIAAFAEGRSTFRGAAELRVKESNRLEAMAVGLNTLGARVTLEPDGWTIEGSAGAPLAGGKVLSRGDHRVAMALLVAGLNCRDGVEIMDDALIETSDPYFPRNLARLVGES
jgi:3-phosphoshikimate 1-carboxyvinyltransferase